MTRNHLEGRSAAFFCYGDGGADDVDAQSRPKVLRHPEYFDPGEEPFEADRDSYAPLVWQCRYSGIEVPDQLWRHVEFGAGKPYSDNQAEHLLTESEVLVSFDVWTQHFAEHVRNQGKVQPNKYRAYGYEAPAHRLADMKLKWREIRMGLGLARQNSSPARQQALDLNRDATLKPKRSTKEQR